MFDNKLLKNKMKYWEVCLPAGYTVAAIALRPKQKFFFFCTKVPSPPPLLNVGEVKNAGANPKPYNIESRGGRRELVVFNLFDNKLFFWSHIFAVVV